MFSRFSRYRQVPDIAVPDAKGRVLAAKDIRPLPDTTGTFRHTVDSGDRLDQLSATYYADPLQYWHICDANPQFLSPLAMLDLEPVVTTRFPVTVTSEPPPWSDALRALATTVGVEDATVEEDVDLVEHQRADLVTVTVRRFRRALLVTYNRRTVEAAAVRTAIASAGFVVGAPVDTGSLGAAIVIPPAVSG